MKRAWHLNLFSRKRVKVSPSAGKYYGSAACTCACTDREHKTFCMGDQSLYMSHTQKGVVGCGEVSCILRHWDVQLILAYSWARPAVFVVGKGRGGMFSFLLFLHFHSCSSFSLSLSFISSTISSTCISFLPFSGRQHKMTLKDSQVVKPQHNQSIKVTYSKKKFVWPNVIIYAYVWCFLSTNTGRLSKTQPAIYLTLKTPRKTASENVVCLCRLLNILANFSNLFLHTGKQCGPRSDCS